MPRRIALGLGLCMCVLGLLLIGQTLAPNASAQRAHVQRPALMLTGVPTLSLNDARELTPGQPLTDAIDENTAVRAYKFSAKAGETYRLAVDLQTGNFWTTVSVTSSDFSQILGESDGEALIDSALHVAIPSSGEYAVTVEYVPATVGTPTPGNYTVTLTRITPK
ncbi:MAG: hypothetical protein ACYDBJ_19355 [Aggregatilineales bacterium]